jgi:hypothetical protein
MIIKKRYLAGIAGTVLICLLVVGTVSAYDADIACLSMREVMAGSHGVTEIELTAAGPLSFSMLGIRLDNTINSDDLLYTQLICTQLKNVVREASTSGRPLSRIVLTLSYNKTSGDGRVSYELSPSTNMFIRLEEPFDPTKPSAGNDQVSSSSSFTAFTDRFLLKKGVTKSSVLANLQRIQKGGSYLLILQSDTTISTGTLQEARDSRMLQLTAGNSPDNDFASGKSALIRKYTSGSMNPG